MDACRVVQWGVLEFNPLCNERQNETTVLSMICTAHKQRIHVHRQIWLLLISHAQADLAVVLCDFLNYLSSMNTVCHQRKD